MSMQVKDGVIITATVALSSVIIAAAAFLWINNPNRLDQIHTESAAPRVTINADRSDTLNQTNNTRSDAKPIAQFQQSAENIRPPVAAPELPTEAGWYHEQQQNADANLAIAGVVRNDQGLPLAGVNIDISPVQQPGVAKTIISDQRGVFRLPGLLAGEYRLRTREDPVYARYFSRAFAGNTALDIELKSLVRVVIRGQVRDQYGNAIDGVQVLLSNSSASHIVTDTSGAFNQTVSITSGEKLSVQFRRDGYQRHRRQVDMSAIEPGGAVDFNITLQRGFVTASGRVVDDNNQPVEGVSVSLHSSSMEVFASASGDQAGMFVLPDLLPASDYRLSVNVAGDYQQYNRQNVTISADSEPLVIALQRLSFGSFEGRVVDSSGVSVGGFELLVKTRGVGGSKRVTTDTDGRFAVQRLAAGRIQLYSSGEPRFSVGNIEVAPGQQVFHELVVDIGDKRIYGTVTDASGEPLAGARVTLHFKSSDLQTESGSTRQTSTKIDGGFEFDLLGNGARKLMVSAPGFASAQLSVDSADVAGPHWITLMLSE